MVRFGARSAVVVILLLGVLPLASGGGALAATAQLEDVGTAVTWQQQSPTNNSTTAPQQENPSQVDGDADSQALENWLSTQLSERLRNSTAQISQGQYEGAQDVLGEQYEDTLSKYLDVTGESEDGDASDDESEGQQRTQFNETAQIQSEYSRTLAEYQEIHTEYRTARDDGEDERARRLARELQTLATELDRLSGSLTTQYQNISESTGASFQNETRTVTNTTQNVTQQTGIVVSEEFTPTSITASSSTRGSFESPITITGNVSTNGTTPLNGSIRIQTPDQSLHGNITENGSFVIPYRPTEVPTGQLTANVTYLPNPNGTYLGSTTEFHTNVTQATPSLQLQGQPSTASYQSSVPVTGRVTVGNRSVPNVSVHLSIGGTVLAENRTTDTGAYNLSTSLPAQVATGTRPLTVRVGAPEMALSQIENQTTIDVRETPTTLSLSTTRIGPYVDVQGHLKTKDGAGIESQTVTVTRDGTVVESIQTNASGVITARIPLTDTDRENSSVQIAAVFDTEDTNLAPARTANTITLSEPDSFFSIELSPSLIASGALLCLASLWYGYVGYQSSVGETKSDVTPEPTPSTAGSTMRSTPATASELEDRLETVSQALDQNDVERAVQALYGTVRAVYSTKDDTTQTHWDFLTAVGNELPPGQYAMLREVTEAYEAVQFANNPPSPDHVTALLTEAETHLEDRVENRNLNPTASQSSE